MSWQKVTVLIVMVAGAIIASWLKNDNLAMVFAGAGAGYLVQQQEKPKNQ